VHSEIEKDRSVPPREFLSGAGVVGEPEVTVLDAVEVAGQF
jgi:hypothetical protein